MQVNSSNPPRRVLIIGGGIAGAATAWALSQEDGVECTVLEKEPQLGMHSTAKNASILRTCTGHTASTQLALETARFLHQPPTDFVQGSLVDPVGLILIPSTLDPQLFEQWRDQKEPGAVEILSASRLRQLMPHWNGCEQGAFLVRDEGHIDTSLLFDSLVRGAKRSGAKFLLDTEVNELLHHDGRVHGVRLSCGRELTADTVVIAAGAWAHCLGRRAGSDLFLEPRRRHLLVTGPEERIDRRSPILWSEPDAFYVRPESGGLMLCACDQDVVQPDNCQALPQVKELIAERTQRCLPSFEDAPAAHYWAGLRTFTDDPEFAIGFDAQVPGLFWVAGLGGHGMSTSIGVGRLATQLLMGKAADSNLQSAVDPGRFMAALRFSPEERPAQLA